MHATRLESEAGQLDAFPPAHGPTGAVGSAPPRDRLEALLALQRSAGNAATARLVQRQQRDEPDGFFRVYGFPDQQRKKQMEEAIWKAGQAMQACKTKVGTTPAVGARQPGMQFRDCVAQKVMTMDYLYDPSPSGSCGYAGKDSTEIKITEAGLLGKCGDLAKVIAHEAGHVCGESHTRAMAELECDCFGTSCDKVGGRTEAEGPEAGGEEQANAFASAEPESACDCTGEEGCTCKGAGEPAAVAASEAAEAGEEGELDLPC
jgi:hypothetical protein